MPDHDRHVPNIGITWMAGRVGPVRAVRLLGRASIYLMAPASQAFQLAWTNRTMNVPSGQMGSVWVTRIRAAGSGQEVPAGRAVTGTRGPRDDPAGGRWMPSRPVCPRQRLLLFSAVSAGLGAPRFVKIAYIC